MDKWIVIAIIAIAGCAAGAALASFQRPNNPWTKRWAANRRDRDA